VRVWDLSDYDCTSVTCVRSSGHPRAAVFAGDFSLSGWEDGGLRVYFADPHNFEATTADALSAGGRVDPRASMKEGVGIAARRSGHEDAGFLWAIPGAHSAASGGVSSVALSHNRRFAVSGGGDGRVRVWNMQSREMISAFTEHAAGVTSLAIYGDDAHVISGSKDKSFACWDLRREKRVSSHSQRAGGINAVALSRDQSLVLTVGKERRLQLWDLREAAAAQSFGPVHGANGEGTTLAAAHGRDLVATGGTDGVVRLWDLRMGRAVGDCVGHSGTVNKVAWSPDDKQIASVGADGALLLWNIFF
jgi:WD40 repeat protein